MKLYVDLESLQLIEGPGFRNPVTSLRFKRGDAAKLEVTFLDDGTTAVSIGDPALLEMRFGVKPRNRYDIGYLVQSDAWTMPTLNAETPFYQCSPSFNTEELNSALGLGSATGSELSEITLMGEITWREGTGEPTSTRTFLVVVENDVNRGTEGVPSSAEPAYPAPQSIVTLSRIGDLAVRHDTEQSLGVSDQLQARLNIGAVGTTDGFIQSATPSGFQIRNHLSSPIATFGAFAPGYNSASFAGSMSVAGSFSVSGSFYGSSVSAANVATSGSISSNTTVSAAGLVMTGDLLSNIFLQSSIPPALTSSALENTGVGSQAMESLTNGARNSGVGYRALKACTTGVNNTGIGHSALALNTIGVGNSAVGFGSLRTCYQGLYNTAMGAEALQNLTTVSENTAVGHGALRLVTTGAANAALGYRAGFNSITGQVALTTGKNNTLLGHWAGVDAAARTQSIALGHRATTQSDGEFAIGAATAAIKGGTTGVTYNTTNHGIDYTVAAPGNPNTPVGWLDARINGTLFKIPLYQ